MKVLLTGASGGIGRAITMALLERGVSVVACCRALNPEYSSWIEAIPVDLRTSLYLETLDLSNVEVAELTIKGIVEKHEIQGLVNNAATSVGSLFMMTSKQTLKSTFEINFFSTIIVSQVVAKEMIKKKQGRIVNISSVSSNYSSRGFLAYGASKAALDYATRIISEELAPYEICVNAVAPGLTETPMLRRMDGDSKEHYRNFSFSKRFSSPDEIANVVTYLLLDSPKQLTGKVIAIDGGMP